MPDSASTSTRVRRALGAAVGGGDDGVVQGDLGRLVPVIEGHEALALRAHSEEGAERLRPGHVMYPGADRSAPGRERLEVRARQRFVELASDPHEVRPASEILQRRF